MDNLLPDAEIMLKRYIYEYMQRKNLHTSAETFKEEGGVLPMQIDSEDSSCGFLSDWWSVFWDMYAEREHGFQQSSYESSLQYPCYEEQFTPKLMEGGWSSSEAVVANQHSHSTVITQWNPSSITDNIIIQNYPIANNQQIQPTPSTQFRSNENWFKLSNNFRSGRQDMQLVNTVSDLDHVAIQNTQSMNLMAPPKSNMSQFGFPYKGKNELSGCSASGISSTSTGIQGRDLWFMNQTENNKLQIPIQQQRQQNLMQRSTIVSMGSNIQSITANQSHQFPPFSNLDGQNSAISVENQNLGKRKEPMHPGAGIVLEGLSKKYKVNLGTLLTSTSRPSVKISDQVAQPGTSKELTEIKLGPVNLPCIISESATESCGVAQLEKSKSTDTSLRNKEGRGTENDEVLTKNNEVDNDEVQKEKQPNTTCEDTGDDKNDSNATEKTEAEHKP